MNVRNEHITAIVHVAEANLLEETPTYRSTSNLDTLRGVKGRKNQSLKFDDGRMASQPMEKLFAFGDVGQEEEETINY